jgi:hypothetical protein
MPYQSRAQQRLFHHLVSQGKLAPEVAEEYDEASKGKKIPQYVKRKAFGGEVYAKKGAHCLACDYPLDDKPLAVDAGEACPRCGFGDAKDVPRRAQGGEITDSSMYRARGGEVKTSFADTEKARKEFMDALYKHDDVIFNDEHYEEFRKKARAIKKKYPYYDDPNLIPVYNQRGERTEHSVRKGANPSRFDGGRRYELAFYDEVDSPAWRLREDLAARGARSGERSTPVFTYVGDGGLHGREQTLEPRMTAEERWDMEHKAEKRARGGEICEHCGNGVPFDGDAALAIEKELYTQKAKRIDDGKIGGSFAKALKNRRR